MESNIVNVLYKELPVAINGFSIGSKNIIVINSHHSFQDQEQTLKHEILHFLLGHFEITCNLSVLEKENMVKDIMNDELRLKKY